MTNKNRFSRLLGFAIEVLFFSNIWVFVYNLILSISRLISIPKPAQAFLLLGVYPEPWEIPLYLAITVVFVLFLFVLHKYVSLGSVKNYLIRKIIVFIILAAIFLFSLGRYPLQGEVSPYQTYESTSFTFFSLFFYLVFVIFLLFETFIIAKFLAKNWFAKKLIFFIITTFLIAFLTFSPRFPISGIDYSLFYGPIWEIAHGKTIFTQTTSIYGFLSFLLLTVLSKLDLFSLSTLPWLIWLMFILEYLICFYLIYKQSHSYLFAMLGLISIITVNYLTFRVIRIEHPQSGPMRFFLPILMLFLLYKFKRSNSYWFSFLVALSSFWVVDVGIQLIMAYLFTLFLIFLLEKTRFKVLFKSVIIFFFNLFFIFIALNLIHLILGYKTIDTASIFIKISQYAKAGFGMLPIENYNYFWLTILFYFATIITVFRNQKMKKPFFYDLRGADPERVKRVEGEHAHGDKKQGFVSSILLFSANLMLFISIYFVGRSHPSELFSISIFVLLNAFMLMAKAYLSLKSGALKFLTIVTLFIIFIFLPVYFRKEAFAKLTQERIKNYKLGKIFQPELIEILNNKYAREIKLIKENIKDKEIIIISGDDTFIYYLTNKTSLLKDNSIEGIITKQDLDKSLEQAIKACPTKIAGECRLFQKCKETELFSKGAYTVQPYILEKLESSCGLKYSAQICTDQLCIGQAQRL